MGLHKPRPRPGQSARIPSWHPAMQPAKRASRTNLLDVQEAEKVVQGTMVKEVSHTNYKPARADAARDRILTYFH